MSTLRLYLWPRTYGIQPQPSGKRTADHNSYLDPVGRFGRPYLLDSNTKPLEGFLYICTVYSVYIYIYMVLICSNRLHLYTHWISLDFYQSLCW